MVNAIIQSVRYSVYTYMLGVNWLIVTVYVPLLVVSSILIFMQLFRVQGVPRARVESDPF